VNGIFRRKFPRFLVEDVGKRQNFHLQAFRQFLQSHYASVMESDGVTMEVHGDTSLDESDALLILNAISFPQMRRNALQYETGAWRDANRGLRLELRLEGSFQRFPETFAFDGVVISFASQFNRGSHPHGTGGKLVNF
jgi:hypothetical protein